MTRHCAKTAAWVVILSWMATSLSGCAPALIPLDRSELTRLRQEPSIRVILHASPTFTIAKPHYGAMAGAFGIVGALVVIGLAKTEGRQWMKECSLEDPASKIRNSLLDAISAAEGLQNLRVDSRTPPSDELAEMRAALGSGTILDFTTTLWELMHDSQEMDRYGLRYAIRSRLIRLDEQAVLWEGFCDSREMETGPKVPLKELKAEAGAVLRERLEAVAAACTDRLFAQFMGRKTTN